MHDMHCRHCGASVTFTPVREKELSRYRQFMILAVVLFATAGTLHLLGVAIWPWWVFGAALFVLSQALFKWRLSRWMMCGNCNARYGYYGIIRKC